MHGWLLRTMPPICSRRREENKVKITCNGFAILALLFVAICFPAIGNAAETCSFCRKTITGSYTTYSVPGENPLLVCTQCNQSLNRCELCGVPTKNKAIKTGNVLCSRCISHAKRCSICNQLIKGTYSVYQRAGESDIAICQNCIQTKPRCSACNRPYLQRDLRAYGNDLWCTECLEKTKICNLCNIPINDKIYTLEYHKGQWCGFCFERSEKCSFCSRPMKTAAAHVLDGRQLCADCYHSSISGTEAVNSIAHQIAPLYEEILGLPVTLPPIRVVLMEELTAVRNSLPTAEGKSPTRRLGKPSPSPVLKELGLFSAQGRKKQILILDTQPEDIMWETIAHELAHAWQFEHFPHCTDPVLVEGFAQWMAEKICYRTHHRTGLQNLHNRDDEYGHAYRTVSNIEILKGERAVIEALSTNSVPDLTKSAAK